MHPDMADGPDALRRDDIGEPLRQQSRDPRRAANASRAEPSAWCPRGSAARDRDTELAQADDAGDDAHGLARRIQHGTLLDMRLEERAENRSWSTKPLGAVGHPRPRIGKPVPSVATSVSASSSDSLPDHTAEPVSAPNRPSSSWKLTTDTGGPPCSRAVRATSSAAITP
jgi:hypothetical protein